jgi:hypothetical protein
VLREGFPILYSTGTPSPGLAGGVCANALPRPGLALGQRPALSNPGRPGRQHDSARPPSRCRMLGRQPEKSREAESRSPRGDSVSGRGSFEPGRFSPVAKLRIR